MVEPYAEKSQLFRSRQPELLKKWDLYVLCMDMIQEISRICRGPSVVFLKIELF